MNACIGIVQRPTQNLADALQNFFNEPIIAWGGWYKEKQQTKKQGFASPKARLSVPPCFSLVLVLCFGRLRLRLVAHTNIAFYVSVPLPVHLSFPSAFSYSQALSFSVTLQESTPLNPFLSKVKIVPLQIPAHPSITPASLLLYLSFLFSLLLSSHSTRTHLSQVALSAYLHLF